MQQALNIVDLIETNPITRLNHTLSNDGYYGMSLKNEDEKHYKNTSNTGKKLKREILIQIQYWKHMKPLPKQKRKIKLAQ